MTQEPPKRKVTKAIFMTLTRLACAALFLVAGVFHFLKPELFERAMPPWIPFHCLLVLITGWMELGFAAVLVCAFHLRVARILIALFLLAVFPANIYMALNPDLFPNLSPTALWLRLPLQFVLIWMVLWCTDKPPENESEI